MLGISSSSRALEPRCSNRGGVLGTASVVDVLITLAVHGPRLVQSKVTMPGSNLISKIVYFVACKRGKDTIHNADGVHVAFSCIIPEGEQRLALLLSLLRRVFRSLFLGLHLGFQVIELANGFSLVGFGPSCARLRGRGEGESLLSRLRTRRGRFFARFIVRTCFFSGGFLFC